MINVAAIDLFCGAGGLTCGLRQTGIGVRLGVDNDPHCRYPYVYNNAGVNFLLASVNDLSASNLRSYFDGYEYTVLAGCAPCQVFSTYYAKAKDKDPRFNLLSVYSGIVEELRADYVLMENVPGVRKHSVFKDFVSSLRSLGYYVSFSVVQCLDYGVAQLRKRLVLLASLRYKIDLIDPYDVSNGYPKTVREAIGDLPKLAAGSRSERDPLHVSAALSELNLLRIRASVPGGTWRDWPHNLLLECHKKETGKSYSSVYGRMQWDSPSPTITTQFYGYCNGRFGHPDQDRALSLREGAILQGFPRDYRFTKDAGQIGMTNVGRLIGNAVPVPLAKAMGLSVIKSINEKIPIS